MDFEAALTAELMSIPQLMNKVFPLVAPEKDVNKEPLKAPYVVYSSSEGSRVKGLDGYQRLKEIDVELYVVASTYPKLKPLESAVIDKLISFELRSIGEDGPFIQEITYEKPVELYESLPKLHRAIINFSVYFE